MDAKLFIERIADIIEAEPERLTLESDFRGEADFWSSLVGFALLTFLEEECGVDMTVEDFIESATIGDLFAQTQNRGNTR